MAIHYATIINMILGINFPQPRNLMATSRNAILALLALLAPLLLQFIELKFQNESISVFEAHPINTRVPLAALLLFSLSFGLEFTFEEYFSPLSSLQARLGIVHLGDVAALLRTSMVFSGSLLVASLTSILFSEEWGPVIYVIYIFLSLANYLYMLVRRGCEWIKEIVNQLQTSFTGMGLWHQRGNPESLPTTILVTRHRSVQVQVNPQLPQV